LRRAAERLREQTAPAEGAPEMAAPLAAPIPTTPGAVPPSAAPPPVGPSIFQPPIVAPGRRAPKPWLVAALRSLAADDPTLARQLLVDFLPSQGPAHLGSLVYDLTIDHPSEPGGVSALRVTIRGGRVTVSPRSDGPAVAEFHVSGTTAQLASLAAGGVGWRLAGAQVEGRR